MKQGQGRIYAGLVLAVCAVSCAAPLIRLANAPPLAVAFYRLALASVILLPTAIRRERSAFMSFGIRDWAILFASAVFLSLHFAVWISSLAYTSVASSVVIVTTQPVFAALFGFLFLREKLTLVSFLGMASAIAGAAVIGAGDFSGGQRPLVGDMLALSGAVFVSGYLLIGRSLRKRMSLLAYVFPVYLFSAVVLGIACALTGTKLDPYPGQTWLYLLLLAVVPQVGGHTMLNWALKHVKAYVVAIAVLGEPVGASILAAILFGELPRAVTYWGGALILGGVALAFSREKAV